MYTVHWYAASTMSRAWFWKLIVMGIIILVAAGFFIVFFIMPRCENEIDSDPTDGIELLPLLMSSSDDENKVCICFYACIRLKSILTVNNQLMTILGPKLNI
jgi:uncharacterized SAM-binding protein YcdF (DUF218 family)